MRPWTNSCAKPKTSIWATDCVATPCAILDACVLYPAPVRDLLLQLARDGATAPVRVWPIQ